MQNVSHSFAETARLVTGGRRSRRSSRADLAAEGHSMKPASVRNHEWTVVRTFPVNALLVGAEHLTSAAVARLETSFRQPLVWWAPTVTAAVPELSAGTLVIRDVDRLEAGQQESLERLITSRGGEVRVLSLARDSLFARVVENRFSPALYSRLNTVVVELEAPADLP
jgi:hypothetical protein